MINSRLENLIKKVDSEQLLNLSLTEWKPILTEDCQVYVFGENYIAKRFDSICYKFCEKDEAKEILIDNLYALLRFKFFVKTSEKIEERISDIITFFTKNLKTTLKKTSFDKNSDANIISMIPDYCLAFRNGVYDFKNNKWLFKYQVTKLEVLANNIYMYDNNYVILWYLDFNFEPLPINIFKSDVTEFINLMKELTKTSRNYCFELMYNIAHNSKNEFSMDKFNHLCEILGYCCLNSFSQHFVMLIGAGQNGKNSLFDGCFTNRVIPSVASNDLESIENDRFITGALENRAHNIYLESTTLNKTYNESKTIKALTGSMYQTIESKGIQKYSGIINCKYIFAANDQSKLKFGDTTTGFRRRINMFEISYQWDKNGNYLRQGDYYNTYFSDDLHELKDDTFNTIAFIYFAMFGIKLATKNFTKNFEFGYNDWNMNYADIDIELKEKIEQISCLQIAKYLSSQEENDITKSYFYDINKNNFLHSNLAKSYQIYNYNDLIDMFSDGEKYTNFFSENEIYISVRLLQKLSNNILSATQFTQSLKKLYNINNFIKLSSNIPYVRCSFFNGLIKILK